MRRLVAIFSAAALMVVLVAAPATAVVDEIVGAWCSGKSLDPPGINGSKRDSNTARPLFASGVIADFHFDDHGDGVGPHVVFDFTRPNVKIESAGFVANFGSAEEPFYVDAFTLKSDFPAFQKCPKLLTIP